jgi:phospholipid/cholesterol/gamma-HCH transport system ATP-binding protein
LSAISFENVNKSFLDQTVLTDFSMEVPSGGMTIILGGSGSGKSTILKLIIGLIKPDSGLIRVGEHEVSSLSENDLMPLRQHVGMVFQAGALFDSLTVGENLAYRLREKKMVSEEEIQEIINEMLGYVGLSGTADKMPVDLSGGMKRRVAIARAMVGDPRIMLYDEPTAGLDPITGRTICELVMKLRDLRKVTSVYVTHDLHAAMTLATEKAVNRSEDEVTFETGSNSSGPITHFIILRGGQVFWEGSYDELSSSEDEYIREFLD